MVQFSTRTFFAQEDEGCMTIDVVRLGDISEVATVEYSCEDGSAKAGVNYTAVTGTLRFDVDCDMCSILVPIIHTGWWNATLEFTMRLHRVENSQLGFNLNQCRVWIIDKDKFPSNNVTEDTTRLGLLYEYFHHACMNPVVRLGSLKMLAIDQLPNLLFVVQLILQVQLVDKVLQPIVQQRSHGVTTQDKLTALAFGSLYALPIFAVNYLQLSKCWMGVGGAARKQLQVDILRKYLNLTTQARAEAGRVGFVEVISRYAVEVVDSGYCRIFDAIRSLGKIIVLLLWSLTVSWMAFPLMLTLPLILIARVYTHEGHSTSLRLKLFKVQDLVVAHADDVARNFGLIRDYHRRPLQAKRLEKVVEEANFFSNAVWDFDTRSALVAPTLATFFAGLLVMASPFLVSDELFTLGEVLAALQAVTVMGEECANSFGILVQIQDSISALIKVSDILNLPTDVADRLRVNRWRRTQGREKRRAIRKSLTAKQLIPRPIDDDAPPSTPMRPSKGPGQRSRSPFLRAVSTRARCGRNTGGAYTRLTDAEEDHTEPAKISDGSTPRFAADMVDLELRNVTLAHPGCADAPNLVDLNLKLRQGRITAVVGAPSSGKASLLRLIAGVLLPTEGEVFAPPHLTIVHVEQQPSLMAMSLIDNLWLGRRTPLNQAARAKGLDRGDGDER